MDGTTSQAHRSHPQGSLKNLRTLSDRLKSGISQRLEKSDAAAQGVLGALLIS